MIGVALGARVAWYRLRRPSTVIALGAAFLLVIASALLERGTAPIKAADRTLLGAVFGLALPLLAYGALELLTEGTRLQQAFTPLIRHGQNGRLVTLGALSVTAGALAVTALLLAVAGVTTARGFSDPELLGDIATTAGIAVIGGAAYACWFALGSQFGRVGKGRAWFLALDWLLGTGSASAAVLWPRGHLRNLLGDQPVLQMSTSEGWLTLITLTLAYAIAVLTRSPR